MPVICESVVRMVCVIREHLVDGDFSSSHFQLDQIFEDASQPPDHACQRRQVPTNCVGLREACPLPRSWSWWRSIMPHNAARSLLVSKPLQHQHSQMLSRLLAVRHRLYRSTLVWEYSWWLEHLHFRHVFNESSITWETSTDAQYISIAWRCHLLADRRGKKRTEVQVLICTQCLADSVYGVTSWARLCRISAYEVLIVIQDSCLQIYWDYTIRSSHRVSIEQ